MRTKKIIPALFAVAIAAVPAASFAAGMDSSTITSINPQTRQITLADGDSYSATTQIDLDQLHVGQAVTLSVVNHGDHNEANGVYE